MDLRQSPAYAQYLAHHGWQIEKIDSDFLFIRRLPLTPKTIIKYQRPERLHLKDLAELAQKHRAWKVYVEPKNDRQAHRLLTAGYQLIKSPFLPSKTVHLNLRPSLATILKNFPKDIRYEIRKAEAEKLTVATPPMATFRQAWRQSVHWQRYLPSLKRLKNLKDHFGKAALFLAANDSRGNILAGAIFLIAAHTGYYFFAFTNRRGRRAHAQTFLLWQAIQQLKEAGCSTLDLEGVFDERFPIKTWQGFSHFKQRFGGREVTYPGCFVKSFPFCQPPHKSS